MSKEFVKEPTLRLAFRGIVMFQIMLNVTFDIFEDISRLKTVSKAKKEIKFNIITYI